MPERQLRQRIRQALRAAFPGALVLQWPSNLWTGAGWPDLLYSEWPLLVGFEVKQGRRSKPTPLQASRHVELRRHHIPVFVVFMPDDAISIITQLKEKLPMAFDQSLLDELEAALGDAPLVEPTVEREPDPESLDVSEPTPANGTVFDEVTLDPDAPAPDIEDLTAAIAAHEEVAQAQTDEVVEAAGKLEDVLRALVVAVQVLSVEVVRLQALLDPTAERDPEPIVAAPARRGRRRAT